MSSSARHVVSTTISVRLPFDADGLLWYLRIRAVPEVEVVTDTGYQRTLRLPHGPAVLGIEFDDSADVQVTGDADPRDHAVVLDLVHRLLDADADPVAIDAHLAADPALTDRVAAIPGIRVPGMVDGDEIIVRTILGQQVSVAAARTAAGKLTASVGARLPAPLARPGLTRLFVSPAELTQLSAVEIGGPRRRAETLVAAARDLADGTLVVAPGLDPAALTAELMARPGIGPWTAQYIAMRVLGEQDELLTGDLALRTGAGRLGLPDTARELAAHGTRWAPYRSYAGQHLWRASRLPAVAG
ncbi:DNA-3-methyladenine glycosylase family protein [Nakamurella deserti]|uniref:DNA-3-methyladenine glycosylase family protein n=1 Tax=Nakamurella deserti TaxID=2164074 RepID=UPI000DBE149E|nr:AlkA N-terminal domain-containing protein [Nakamurella deserti]